MERIYIYTRDSQGGLHGAFCGDITPEKIPFIKNIVRVEWSFTCYPAQHVTSIS